MTIEKLQAVLHASPFQPFTIYMADGRSIHAPTAILSRTRPAVER